MSKRFFYVCAGIFLLVLSYHFGAESARAQVGGSPLGAVSLDNGTSPCAVDGSGRLFISSTNFSSTAPHTPAATLALPRPGNVIACAGLARPGGPAELAKVIYDDGSSYDYYNGAWVYQENLFSGSATAAQGASWGQMKDRYRR